MAASITKVESDLLSGTLLVVGVVVVELVIVSVVVVVVVVSEEVLDSLLLLQDARAITAKQEAMEAKFFFINDFLWSILLKFYANRSSYDPK